MTKQNLTYTYGSADPQNGGMDCSGTIYYLLQNSGMKDVPRDSPGQYSWVRKSGKFQAVISKSAESFEFKELRPGDLLFWTGTYQVEREIPISHVMLYLGVEKRTKKRVMFGASDGRSYGGVARWGVSVFDFQMPRAREGEQRSRATFVGYGPIPSLASIQESASEPKAEAETESPEQVEKEKSTASTPTPTPLKKSSSSAKSGSKSKRK